jgi:hypothetical protein
VVLAFNVRSGAIEGMDDSGRTALLVVDPPS